MPSPANQLVVPGASEELARIVLDGALSEACQQLRQHAGFAADLVFVTDAEGRFVHVSPDGALGWPPGELLGQAASVLLGGADTAGAAFNPFFPQTVVTRRHVWLRRFDGSSVLMAVSVAPRLGHHSEVAGACGIGIDLQGTGDGEPHLRERMRRMEVLDLVTDRMNHADSSANAMGSLLSSLLHAIGAEGVAVIGAAGPSGEPIVLHDCGLGISAIQDTAFKMLAEPDSARFNSAPDGRLLALASFLSRSGAQAGLVVWRANNGLPWAETDIRFAASTVGIIRIIMDQEAVRNDMARAARIDPLTGLLNRHTFLEELKRHLVRLDREQAPGTMLLIDLDEFKPINDQLGHHAGDRILGFVADRLRAWIRPTDLVARLSGDEFAVWLNGTDHLTAAERADMLCRTLPGEVAAAEPDLGLKVGLSIGIATRQPNHPEAADDVLRRADLAMYDAKRNGRGQWRVSLENQM